MKIKIIAIISFLAFVLLTIVIVWYVDYESKKLPRVASAYREIVIKRGWGSEKDLPKEELQKAPELTINSSIKIIFEQVSLQAANINYDKKDLNTRFKEIQSMVLEKKFFDSLEKTKRLLDKIDDEIKKYKSQNSKSFDAIKDVVEKELTTYLEEKDFSVVNYRIFNDWAIATILLSERNTDPGNVVLKKDGDAWTIKSGPGTYFEKDELLNMGAPQEIIENANRMLSKDVFN